MVEDPQPRRIVFVPDARRELEKLISLTLSEESERRLIHTILILMRKLARGSGGFKIVRGDISVAQAFELVMYFLCESDRVVILRVFTARE